MLLALVNDGAPWFPHRASAKVGGEPNIGSARLFVQERTARDYGWAEF